MRRLKSYFRQEQYTPVPRKELAAIVQPFTADQIHTDNEALAYGWRETATWLRIGFGNETDKGELYTGLYKALQLITAAIERTAENTETVSVRKSDLAMMKAGYSQFEQAIHHLNTLEQRKLTQHPQKIKDRQGNLLTVPVVPIYSRPHAPHGLMAIKLEAVQSNLDSFFENIAIKNLTNRQVSQYAAPLKPV